MDYTLLLTTAFLLLYVNFLFTSYHIFDIEYGAVVTVDIFRTKVFIIVKQFAKLQIIQDLFLHCFNKKKISSRPFGMHTPITILKNWEERFKEVEQINEDWQSWMTTSGRRTMAGFENFYPNISAWNLDSSAALLLQKLKIL